MNRAGANTAAALRVDSNGAAKTAAAAKEASFLRRALLLVGCSLGIYATFLLYGILQERMYTHEYGEKKERFQYSMFLVFFQCIGNAAFAVALGLFSPPTNRVAAPAAAYFGMSASYIGAMFSSNLALGFMSYPAQALAKSCKLIPVMVSRLFVVKDVKYTRREVAQVILITLGIVVFMLGAPASASKKVKETSWLGLALCLVSLVMDGYTGPAQEKLNKEYKLTMSTMMFWLNVWASLLVAAALILTQPITGELQAGLAFCINNPTILPEAALFSLMAASGQAMILYTLLQFNSLIVVIITTTRKFFTILLSVVVYGHSLNGSQWSGVALVFVGLSLDIYAKWADRNKKKKHEHGKGARNGSELKGQ